MSRVSIIIPAFNQARFLRRAVESAVSQTHPDVEVIIVDDGSTDGTAALCADLREWVGVTVIAQDNQGVGAARNRGARAATGDYLCFLDADDYYAPAKAATQAALLDRSDAIDWTYCDIVSVNEEDIPHGVYSVRESRRVLNGDILGSLIVGGFFPPHTVMLRRRVFDTLGGFDPALGGHADFDLWLRLAAAGHQVEFIDEKLAVYRRHPGGMSRDLAHMRETRIAALTRLAREYPERMAVAVSRLQDTHEDLHEGNRWLNDALHQAMALTPLEPTPLTTLVDEFGAGRVQVSEPNHGALWTVPAIGQMDPVLGFVLHPPAAATFEVESGEACTVRGAATLHPQIWTHPDSGACQFQITVDDRVRWTCLLDPAVCDDDRRWVPFELDVPAASSGRHLVCLETTGVNGDGHRWAMWRDVRLVQRSFSSQKLQPKAGCTPL